MNVVIIGTGYVGLVSGTCFAEMGHVVTCVDVDKNKIEQLCQGHLPIYEPGLEEMVAINHSAGRLRFSTSLKDAAKDANVFFIAVGTPPEEDGSADLKYVLGVASELGKYITPGYNVIVDKSTVPVGTADKVRSVIRNELAARVAPIDFDVVSNPEFLKEGAAINDFMHPDRVVIGSDSEKAAKIMSEVYLPFTRNHDVIISMGIREAEMTKYTANALLATKISFMNEIAGLCEGLGVDVEQVRLGIGSDRRIGYQFIYPGCGYGGSCFPKDVKALVRMAESSDFDVCLLNAVEERNVRQKMRLYEKIVLRFGHDLEGKTFALWGLAFKPGTDDIREAPALVLIDLLINAGANIRAYDPVAMASAMREMKKSWLDDERIVFVEEQYDALVGSDALVIVTEWKQFRTPDFNLIRSALVNPVIFDGRNQYDPQTMTDLNFEYWAIGRGTKH